MEAADEETAQVGQWQLADYAEIHVRLRGQTMLRNFSVACVSSHKISLRTTCFRVFGELPRMAKPMEPVIFFWKLTTE